MPEVESRKAAARQKFEKLCADPLPLDLTRGKPCAAQFDLSDELLRCVGPGEVRDEAGNDCRNYGVPDGLPGMRALFAELLELSAEGVLIGGNSSLALMFDVLSALRRDVWREPAPVLLCPVPGYDRHFTLSAHLGFGMQNIAIGANGLDIESIERAAADDARRVKGIWIVPRYQNPTGYTLRDEEVQALARMKTAAPDFRIFWDNAYMVHALEDEPAPLANLQSACAAAGHPDRALHFGSTSKISFAGGGIAAFGGSAANVEWMRRQRIVRTINGDKLNQLRHLRFFRNAAGVRAHMRRHAAILRPKFEAVQRGLEAELKDTGLAEWTKPKGGYFVSLDTCAGHAQQVCALAARAGVKLTPAGATFPHGKDPQDRNLRIAPTFPSVEELERAIAVLGVAIQVSAA